MEIVKTGFIFICWNFFPLDFRICRACVRAAIYGVVMVWAGDGLGYDMNSVGEWRGKGKKEGRRRVEKWM